MEPTREGELARPLSYERLLEIIQVLPKEDRVYILSFLTNNERKLRFRLGEIEAEKRQLEKSRRQYETFLHEKAELEARLGHLQKVLSGNPNASTRLRRSFHNLANHIRSAKHDNEALQGLIEEVRAKLAEWVGPTPEETNEAKA